MKILKYDRLARVSHIPHVKDMRRDTIYLISEPGELLRQAYRGARRIYCFLCPCGACTVPSVVTVECDKPPNWTARLDDQERVTFSPSIYRNWDNSCKSHYFIEDSKVRWC